MNKLQLYISKSLREFKSVHSINASDDVQRHIRDVRRALESLDYDPAEKYLFYLISYIDGGAFFTILRTIPGRPLDHLATTIFVPAGLDIPREEMTDIVRRTTRMVSNPSVSAEDISDLHKLFAKEYAVDEDAPACEPSQGDDYACCLYGADTGHTLEDFYAGNLYRPGFSEYAGVLLVDASLGVSSVAPAPEADDEASEPDAEEDDAAEEEPTPVPSPRPQRREQRRIYRFELPVKSSELGAPIHFEIHTRREMTESPVEGYELLDDIKEGAARGNYLRYVGAAPRMSMRNAILCIVAALVVGCMLGWFLKGCSSRPAEADIIYDSIPEVVEKENSGVPQTQPQSEPETPKAATTVRPAGTVTAEAIKYLDNNTVWQRDRLEQLGLAGLFDDMNNYRLQRLVDIWGVKLKASERFGKVSHHAGQSIGKKIFRPQGTYCAAGDNSIAVQSYLNRIDPAKKK